MQITKTSKNSEFLSSLIRKKTQQNEIINKKKKINFNQNDLHLNETELKIENKVFNNDIVLYAKSQTTKQR